MAGPFRIDPSSSGSGRVWRPHNLLGLVLVIISRPQSTCAIGKSLVTVRVIVGLPKSKGKSGPMTRFEDRSETIIKSGKQLRDALVPVTLAGSLLSISWGLEHSPILSWDGWIPVMIWQVPLLALGAVCATGLVLVCQRLWHIRIELGLALVAAAALAAAFGPLAIIVVGLFMMSSAIIGTSLSARLSGTSELPLVFAIALGAAMYSITFTLLGPLPVNTFAAHSMLLATPLVTVCIVPSLRRAFVTRFKVLSQQTLSIQAKSAAEISGLAVLLFLALLHGLLAALPERYFDAMVMHLYIPSYVSANKTWNYDPTLYAFAFVPAGVDFLYAHFFVLQGEMAAEFFNLSAFMFTCAILYTVVQRVANREIAIWVVALFASMPIAFLETSTLFIENTLMLWLTSAAGVVVISALRLSLRHAVAIFVFLAAASMAKLNGALAGAVIGPLVLCLFVWQRRPIREIIRLLATCAVCAIFALFPYGFAWFETGNPVFPFYNDVFKSPFFATTPFIDTRWVGHFDWRLLYDATFASTRFLEANPGALGLTVILLLPLAVVAMIVRPNKAGVVSLLLALAIMLPIAWQTQYLRYFYPAFPILFIAGACGLLLLSQRFPKRVATFTLLLAVVMFNVYKISSAGWPIGNFDLAAVFDSEKRRALVVATVPERLANIQINQMAGRFARVLYNGNPFGALLSGKALYSDWYNMDLFNDVAKLTTTDQASALLIHWNVSHVVYSADSEKPGQKVLGTFLAENYRPIARFGHIILYDLRTSAVR